MAQLWVRVAVKDRCDRDKVRKLWQGTDRTEKVPSDVTKEAVLYLIELIFIETFQNITSC